MQMSPHEQVLVYLRICLHTGYRLYSQYIRLSEQLYSTAGLRFISNLQLLYLVDKKL